MMQEKHQKHTALVKPYRGTFHRNEWAFLGTACGKIQDFAQQLITRLNTEFRTAYLDADHQSGAENIDPYIEKGAELVCTDKIGYFRQDVKVDPDTLSYRNWFDEADLVLVNGNHFKAARQIVFVDPKKEDSLRRKLDRLKQVDAIILTEGQSAIFPFLAEKLGDKKTPVFSLAEAPEAIAALIRQQCLDRRPPLHGLVLAGGMSRRMGQDKGLMEYHGKPQRLWMADLISEFCEETFISCRPDQTEELSGGKYPPLADTFTGLGPFGAIASAFRSNPNAAWLVVACDLPLLGKTGIQQLVESRNASKIATAFNSPVNQFPEPLVAIWEPRSYPALLHFLTLGYACPRKVLINTDIARIDIQDNEELSNVNDPEAYTQIMDKLSKGNQG